MKKIYRCQWCKKRVIKKQSKELSILCRVNHVYFCSMECYNNWEAYERINEIEEEENG